jgi:hypothetical protein
VSKPYWDLLVVADNADHQAHLWFPFNQSRTVQEYLALEGLRPRNVYVTSRAITEGTAGIFQHLYRMTVLSGGSVRHVSDYEEPNE